MKMYKIYFFAFAVYALPFISLGIFIIDGMTINKTEAIFLALFLISPLPCGLIGIVLSLIGFIKSFKNKNEYNKEMGVVGILVGLLFLFGGIFGFMLIYFVVLG
jgi:hypothetical protein